MGRLSVQLVAAWLGLAILAGCRAPASSSPSSQPSEPPHIQKKRRHIRALREMLVEDVAALNVWVSMQNTLILYESDLQAELEGRAELPADFPIPPAGVQVDRREWREAWLRWHLAVVDFHEVKLLQSVDGADRAEAIAAARAMHEEALWRLVDAGYDATYDGESHGIIARALADRRARAEKAAREDERAFLEESIGWWAARERGGARR